MFGSGRNMPLTEQRMRFLPAGVCLSCILFDGACDSGATHGWCKWVGDMQVKLSSDVRDETLAVSGVRDHIGRNVIQNHLCAPLQLSVEGCSERPERIHISCSERALSCIGRSRDGGQRRLYEDML